MANAKQKQVTKPAARRIVVNKGTGEPLRTAGIAPATVIKTAPAPVSANVKANTKVGTKPATKGATKGAHKGLWFFQQTPGGNLLRAYFMAYIIAAMPKGKIAIGVPFKLWPSANLRGHIVTGKVEYKGSGMFALRAPGYNYFTSPEQAADEATLKAMLAAIRTGKKPDVYKFEMSPIPA